MPFSPPEISFDETADSSKQRGQREKRERRAARLKSAHPLGMTVTVDLGLEPVVLGRAPDGRESPPIHDQKISREHFRVEWDPILRTHVGRDLGSRNGSSVGGHPCTSAWYPLEDGSVVRIGDLLLVYELGHTLEVEDHRDVSRAAVPGEACTVRALRAKMASAAPDLAPVLITGETGTGKEEIAKELHALSGRRGPFIPINCSTLNEQLIESQLFGHVKGAFTGATSDHEGLFRAAAGGTLFLDEIGEMPLALQPKLLRAIQEREVIALGSTRSEKVEVRIVAATHRDLEARAREGSFRQDLYARLALWTLEVPALRQRKSDLLRWIELLFAAWSKERGLDGTLDLDADAAEALLLFDWPENLRGVHRLVHDVSGKRRERIRRVDLPSWVLG